MQIPKRRSQLLKIQDDENLSVYLTPQALERLKKSLDDLMRERPQVVEDLRIAVQKGDLSENAEYQDAKARLGRIDGRIFATKEKIKNAVMIEKGPDASGRIRLGSTVLLSINGRQKAYSIVGPQESNPTQGRISHISPLGAALLGHSVGETVTLHTESGDVMYGVVDVT